ncbi:DUF368 domain-containing protein [Algibacter miyuki]|nr:DUF368 domain-containing protein [Algibacter miyuki]MDN3667645.1 DUF368 domain-containing protein [Algibacter miyuki]
MCYDFTWYFRCLYFNYSRGLIKLLSDAFHDFDIKKIFIFAGGALVGLLSFSHLLKWLFKHYHNITLAVLTGLFLGP